MLNCCIEKKIAREALQQGKVETNTSDKEESDEDEFFDCEDSLNIEDVKKVHKPLGRLKKCGKLKLLHTGDPMYVPITQDPAPVTEDVVDEQCKMLIELGDDAEGSELRAKMMSASLTSDVQAFKAANPGASLEDFVRWYSPRDWIESEEVDSSGNPVSVGLSPRMQVPDNLWQQVWSNTEPVPCHRQKRLFDDTKEAEKVLQWMTSASIKDICQLLYPCLLNIAVLKIFDEVDKLPIDYNMPLTLTQQLCQLTRTGVFPTDEELKNPDGSNVLIGNVMSSFALAESNISQLHSFVQKFPEVSLNEAVMCDGDQKIVGSHRLFSKFIKVEGGLKSSLGLRIKDIFCKELAINQMVEPGTDFKFGRATKRVFVLKYLPRKSDSSSPLSLPQRMSCCLKSDEFLVAGTFSKKTDIC